jgi:hypothetical protein
MRLDAFARLFYVIHSYLWHETATMLLPTLQHQHSWRLTNLGSYTRLYGYIYTYRTHGPECYVHTKAKTAVEGAVRSKKGILGLR